jgi:hypothetical protein
MPLAVTLIGRPLSAPFYLTLAHIRGPLTPEHGLAEIRRLGFRGLLETLERPEPLGLLPEPYDVDEEAYDAFRDFEQVTEWAGWLEQRQRNEPLALAFERYLIASAEAWVSAIARLVSGENAFAHHARPLEQFERLSTREGWLLVGLEHEFMNPSFDEYGTAAETIAGAECWPDVSEAIGVTPGSRFELTVVPRTEESGSAASTDA